MRLEIKEEQIKNYEKQIEDKNGVIERNKKIPLKNLFINNQLKDDLFFFDLINQEWSSIKAENFTFNSNLGIAVIDQSTIFLLGGAEGQTQGSPSKGSKSVYKLTFPDMKIKQMRDYCVERFAFGVTVIRDNIVIAGGSINDTKQTDSVEQYLLPHDVWCSLPHLNQ